MLLKSGFPGEALSDSLKGKMRLNLEDQWANLSVHTEEKKAGGELRFAGVTQGIRGRARGSLRLCGQSIPQDWDGCEDITAQWARAGGTWAAPFTVFGQPGLGPPC